MAQKYAKLAAFEACLQEAEVTNHNDNTSVISSMSGMSEMKVQQLVANAMSTQNNDENARLRAELDELKSQLSSTSFTCAQGGGESTGGGGSKIYVGDGKKIGDWVKTWTGTRKRMVLYNPNK